MNGYARSQHFQGHARGQGVTFETCRFCIWRLSLEWLYGHSMLQEISVHPTFLIEPMLRGGCACSRPQWPTQILLDPNGHCFGAFTILAWAPFGYRTPRTCRFLLRLLRFLGHQDGSAVADSARQISSASRANVAKNRKACYHHLSARPFQLHAGPEAYLC